MHCPTKLLIGNRKCDNADNDDADDDSDGGYMIPMCRPYIAGDTIKTQTKPIDSDKDAYQNTDIARDSNTDAYQNVDKDAGIF